MATHLHHDDCGNADCCAVPHEFVRLRYYFGQRLGVVDLFDEQRYHAGKQRFHNLRGHGAGVLCGLTAERFTMPGTGSATTVLKVKRGSALDPCGRELVVDVDQCIDVAAWFQKHRDRLEWAAGDHTLTIAISYRECPSDPAPAPRDPCGCDSGGCEFGRVREGFELKLLTDKEAEHCFDETFPERLAMRQAAASGDVAGAIERLVGAACPARVDDDACLCLASVTVTVGEQPLRVTAISEPNNGIPTRTSLLSTAALQELVLAMTGQTGAGSAAWPTLGTATFAPASNELAIPIVLASDGAPIAQATFSPSFVQVRRFDQNAWLAPETVQVSLDTGAIRLKWSAPPQQGNYRLSIVAPPETPISDQRMRALGPVPFALQFSLTGNPLALGEPSF